MTTTKRTFADAAMSLSPEFRKEVVAELRAKIAKERNGRKRKALEAQLAGMEHPQDMKKDAMDSERVRRAWKKRKRIQQSETEISRRREEGRQQLRAALSKPMKTGIPGRMRKGAADSARVKLSWRKRRRAHRQFVVQDGLDAHNGFQAHRQEIFDAWEKAGHPGTVQEFAHNWAPKRRRSALSKADLALVDEIIKRDNSRDVGPNKKSSPKEIVGHHGHHPHGHSILWPAMYEELRAKGMAKEKAARISNAAWNKKHGDKAPKSARAVVQ